MELKSVKSAAVSSGRKGKGCSTGCLLVLIVVVILISGLEIFRRNVVRNYEENYLKTYKPKREIADLAEKMDLTDEAKNMFYRSDPEFIPADTFVEYCLKGGIEMALACARSETPGAKKGSKPRIFLLEIDDIRFVDSKYPSAAHELLHLVYHKFTTSEKQRIDNLVDQEIERHKDDPHIVSLSNILTKAGGNYQDAIRGEMHSVFGVEYRDISPELETYYAKYFTNRAGVVSLYEQGGLGTRVRKMIQLSNEIQLFESKLTALNTQLDQYKKAGDEAGYNSLVPQFNNIVSQHNAKVAESNRINSEMSELYKYFNSNYQSTEKTTL